MTIYSVIDYRMNGRSPIAVFSSREFAEKFAAHYNFIAPMCRIEKFGVIGKQPLDSKTVFACHEYHGGSDMDWLRAFYWDYDQALLDGDEDHRTFRYGIDERMREIAK